MYIYVYICICIHHDTLIKFDVDSKSTQMSGVQRCSLREIATDWHWDYAPEKSTPPTCKEGLGEQISSGPAAGSYFVQVETAPGGFTEAKAKRALLNLDRGMVLQAGAGDHNAVGTAAVGTDAVYYQEVFCTSV